MRGLKDQNDQKGNANQDNIDQIFHSLMSSYKLGYEDTQREYIRLRSPS